MSLTAAINGLNTVMDTLPNLRVYPDPPESISQFPSCITYVQEGAMEARSSGGISLHTLIAEIYVARQMLPQAVDGAKVWPDLVFAALKADPYLRGSVSHVVWEDKGFKYRMGPMDYGGTGAIFYGCRFSVVVKINEV